MEPKIPKKIAHRSIRKVDAVITGMILGGIVASIYGISKEGEKHDPSKIDIAKIREGKVPLSEILKMLVFGVPKEKPSFFSKIASFFRKK